MEVLNPQDRLTICLFGGVEFRIKNKRVSDFVSKKVEALLIYLWCNPKLHRRDFLAHLFWGDLPEKRANGNLRLALNNLRKHFEPYLIITRLDIGIDVNSAYWLDTEILKYGFQSSYTKLDERETLYKIMKLYQGEFLEGFHLSNCDDFTAWQFFQREQFHQKIIAILHHLADLCLYHSDYEIGVEALIRLLQIDPLDELGHQKKMIMLARAGNRVKALQQYEICCQILSDEFNIEPMEETQNLFRRIRNSPVQRIHNLPPMIPELIGRKNEVNLIHNYLNEQNRLITLVGMGGAGKSLIALHIGLQIIQDNWGPFIDGVCYISIIEHDNTDIKQIDEDLLILIAEKQGISLSRNLSILSQVSAALNEKECLFIIDNAEYLSRTARYNLIQLIQQTQYLQFILTSRESLQLSNEWVIDIGGLPYADLAQYLNNNQIPQSILTHLKELESVQLFLTRAQQVNANFTLDNSIEQLRDLARLTDLVYGLPLALELAAAWVRIFSLSQIVNEIRKNLNILTTDMQDIPPRHRSMRAVFETSWQMLSISEQENLIKLSVFSGNFDQEAAEHVAEVNSNNLLRFCNQSFLQQNPHSHYRIYRIHPLLKQFIIEKLPTSNIEFVNLQYQHAAYYAQFTRARQPHLKGESMAQSLDEIELNMENIRQAWRWAVKNHDLEILDQYSVTLHDFFVIRGWEYEGSILFQEASTLVQQIPDANQLTAVRILSRLGEFYYTLGELDKAETYLYQSFALINRIEDPTELTFTYKQLGLICYWRGNYKEALRHYDLCLQIAESVDDHNKIGHTLLSMGAVAQALGDWAAAETYHRRSLEAYRTINYEWGICHALRFLGNVMFELHKFQLALQYYSDSLNFARKIGNRTGEAMALNGIAVIHLANQELSQAQVLFEQSLHIFDEIGIRRGISESSNHLGEIFMAMGDFSRSKQYLLRAYQDAQDSQALPLVMRILLNIARLLFIVQENEGMDNLHNLFAYIINRPESEAITRQKAQNILNTLGMPDEGVEKMEWHLEDISQYIQKELSVIE